MNSLVIKEQGGKSEEEKNELGDEKRLSQGMYWR